MGNKGERPTLLHDLNHNAHARLDIILGPIVLECRTRLDSLMGECPGKHQILRSRDCLPERGRFPEEKAHPSLLVLLRQEPHHAQEPRPVDTDGDVMRQGRKGQGGQQSDGLRNHLLQATHMARAGPDTQHPSNAWEGGDNLAQVANRIVGLSLLCLRVALLYCEQALVPEMARNCGVPWRLPS